MTLRAITTLQLASLLVFLHADVSSAESVIISEIQTLNKRTLVDSDGEARDWIEIQNLSREPLSLEGWFLSDDPGNLGKWGFPALSIEPKAFLLVFASGKDRAVAGGELHTNFKLSARGEFLALVKPDGKTVAHRYAAYPAQIVDVSYGVSAEGEASFFPKPSPGRENLWGLSGVLPEPTFTPARGFHDRPLRVEIKSASPGAEILYTLDGSAPTRENAQIYRGAIPVKTTTVLRARAFKEGQLPSVVETHSYLFLADIVNQGNSPPGYPGTLRGKKGPLTADYEMDPEITRHPSYAKLMDDALLALPTLSLVTNVEHLFDPEQGIYQNTKQHGMAWERPVSVEWIYPDGRKGFQVDAGVRIQGNGSRTPRKSPKHAFRLVFRKIYGPGKLDFPIFDDGRAVEEFDTLILRAEFNQSWTHHNDQRVRGQHLRDQWMKDTQRAMGHPSPHLVYAHLYLNGIYWGLYSPYERANAEFGAAYEGGEPEDYDATNSGRAIDGNLDAYKEVFRLAAEDTEKDSVYRQLEGLVDIDSFIDYMILNQYAGNLDRDSHNWYSIHRRQGGGLQYVSWDAESVFINIDDNRLSLNQEDSPSGLFQSLIRNDRFKLEFADHVHRHFFDHGLLTAERGKERYERRAWQLVDAVIAESARWGDYRRDVHPLGDTPAALLERDVHWQRERKRVLEEIFPRRTAVVLEQYREAGYYPRVDAPELSRVGGSIPEDFELTLSTKRGQIYYTLEGSDPRRSDGKPSTVARRGETSAKLVLQETTRLKARTLLDGEWSALTEARYSRSGGLRVSEIMFHATQKPGASGSDTAALDFLELTNVSAHALDLSGVRLTGAVEFSFGPENRTRLEAGEIVVLVADLKAFKERYGIDRSRVVGTYKGKLSNAGEPLKILDGNGETVLEFTYKDHWYPRADGRGSSLVVVDLAADPQTWSLRESWRASQTAGGSPGVVETTKQARREPRPHGGATRDG